MASLVPVSVFTFVRENVVNVEFGPFPSGFIPLGLTGSLNGLSVVLRALDSPFLAGAWSPALAADAGPDMPVCSGMDACP